MQLLDMKPNQENMFTAKTAYSHMYF